jgi:ribosomal protein L29
MVEKKINEKIRGREEADIKTEITKLKDELKNLRNSKAASSSGNKLAKIKVSTFIFRLLERTLPDI